MSSKRMTRKRKKRLKKKRHKVKGLERVIASLSLIAYADHFMGQEPQSLPSPRVESFMLTQHEFSTRAPHFRSLMANSKQNKSKHSRT